MRFYYFLPMLYSNSLNIYFPFFIALAILYFEKKYMYNIAQGNAIS